MTKPQKRFVVAYLYPASRQDILRLVECMPREEGRIGITAISVDDAVQTIEQALFFLSNEMDEPQVIALLDYEQKGYNVKELSERIRYHFPKTDIVLLVEDVGCNPKEIFQLYECLDYVLDAAHMKELSLPASDAAGGGAAHAVAREKPSRVEVVSADAASKFIKKDIGEEFSSFQINTPVAPRSLEEGEGVADILSRPRSPARVLLVFPQQTQVYGFKLKPAYAPQGVLCVAAMLEKAGHLVTFFDMSAEEMSTDALLKIVGDGYDVVGISSVTASYPNALEIAGEIKKRFPGIKTILGGIHATVNSRECAAESAFDFVVAGEGECTAVELVDAIMRKDKDFGGIKGILYKQRDAQVVSTPMRSLVPNLDDLPFPSLHLLKDITLYSPPDLTLSPVAPIMVSRGCPGQCTYCQTKNIFGRRTRFRSPDKVIEHIRELHRVYGIKELHILDDVFTANRRFVMEFCRLLKAEPYKLNIEFSNGVRADMVNEEILSALKEVGLKNVGFGVETGNERVAKIIKKGIRKDQVRKAFAAAKKVGLDTWGFFILGLPGDDEQSVQDTVDFAIELDPKYAKFLILKPFPGSEVYYQLDEKGLIDSKDYAMYGVYTAPVHHLEKLSGKRILELQKKAFRRFYFRPGKILEHVRGINSKGKLISSLKGLSFIVERVFK